MHTRLENPNIIVILIYREKINIIPTIGGSRLIGHLKCVGVANPGRVSHSHSVLTLWAQGPHPYATDVAGCSVLQGLKKMGGDP